MSAGDAVTRESSSRRRNRLSVATVVIIVLLASLVVAYSYLRNPQGGIQTTTTACTTIYPGQPLGASLRVVNATTLEPVARATVNATAPVSGICGASSPIPISVLITTNSTEWYSLPFINRGTYQIAVTYLGRSYSVTMPLGLSVYNCATLYVPTGQTNVTTTGGSQMPCQSILG